ncbi:MAG: hypothetical protein K9J16_16690 [Melioribacteraceae bacterium]|nr:hypothetical protein [Melioribacteraceae bacterium]MCF8354990.1 hypothetical protein [Melioribacteraceae bacterium]MCF8394315.1 hypothetical protein [Melioribacteraceae bacterium]MCF8419994.1 hypothetical protein [Melioribacteraceae bacterium]
MKNKLILFVVCSMIFGGIISAQEHKFQLLNQTEFDVYEIYISPAEDEVWGEDILDSLILSYKDTIDITIDLADECKWDLMILDELGNEFIWEDIPICEIKKLLLYLDDENIPQAIWE